MTNEMKPSENLRGFAEFVRLAPTDEKAERFVRNVLAGIAASCTNTFNGQLAECVIECRRNELRGEAGLN